MLISLNHVHPPLQPLLRLHAVPLVQGVVQVLLLAVQQNLQQQVLLQLQEQMLQTLLMRMQWPQGPDSGEGCPPVQPASLSCVTQQRGKECFFVPKSSRGTQCVLRT